MCKCVACTDMNGNVNEFHGNLFDSDLLRKYIFTNNETDNIERSCESESDKYTICKVNHLF